MERWRRIALSAGRAENDGRGADAIRLYQKAARLAERTGETAMLGVILHNLGMLFYQANEGPQAREVLIKARDVLSSADGSEDAGEYLIAVLRKLGSIEVDIGTVDAAMVYLQEAMRHALARSDADGATRVHVDLGIALKDAGRLSEARDELTMALGQARERGLERVTAHALTVLGLVEEKLRRPASARTCYGEALALYRTLVDPSNEATVLYNLASLDDAAGKWDEAERGFNEALALFSALDGGAGDLIGVADCRAALASIEIDRGNPARARELHEAAVDIFRAGGHSRRVIDSLVDLAAIARDDGRLAEGSQLLAEASQLAVELTDPLVTYDVELHWGDLCFKAGDDPGARSHYAQAAAVMQRARSLLTREEEALSFFDADRLEDIDRLITLTATEDPQGCVEWIERAKGQELLRQLDREPVPHAPSWADMQHLLERIAADDPTRAVVFVHYYVRETVTAVVGVMPHREPYLVAVEVPMAELHSAVTDPRHPSWQHTEQLLAPLIAPIAAWAAAGDRVLLCPHDALHRFPLHAIGVDGQVLGERNEVSYVPSAAVLRHCLASRRAANLASGDAVILADASLHLPEGLGAGPLPLARDQAIALESLLAEHHWSVRRLTGDTATLRELEESFGGDAAAPALVHFAVHGFTSLVTGLDSGLKLTDGELTARHMLELRLGGALVCMAACDTGIGERLAGDELLGLVRSALRVGASTVIASLWPVDQLSSSMLMLDFYQRVLDGDTKAAALRGAQLQLREATVSTVLAHLARARQRLAGSASDPHTVGEMRADAAISLAEARLRLMAHDVDAALADVTGVLSLNCLTGPESRGAADLRDRILLVARKPRDPDYARRPFNSVDHWAPFTLVGNPA